MNHKSTGPLFDVSSACALGDTIEFPAFCHLPPMPVVACPVCGKPAIYRDAIAFKQPSNAFAHSFFLDPRTASAGCQVPLTDDQKAEVFPPMTDAEREAQRGHDERADMANWRANRE